MRSATAVATPPPSEWPTRVNERTPKLVQAVGDILSVGAKARAAREYWNVRSPAGQPLDTAVGSQTRDRSSRLDEFKQAVEQRQRATPPGPLRARAGNDRPGSFNAMRERRMVCCGMHNQTRPHRVALIRHGTHNSAHTERCIVAPRITRWLLPVAGIHRSQFGPTWRAAHRASGSHLLAREVVGNLLAVEFGFSRRSPRRPARPRGAIQRRTEGRAQPQVRSSISRARLDSRPGW